MDTCSESRVKYRNQCAFYSKGEEIFNAVSHIAGGAIGIAIFIVGVVFAYPSVIDTVAMAIFGASVILLYTMSALYHFLRAGTAKNVFRIFDHCTIFLLIAGTYTPYCLIALKGTTVGTCILVAEWTLAVVGIVGNAVAMNNKAVKCLSMILYCVMGWMIATAFRPLYASISHQSFWLLAAGGAVYTAGIAFYALGRKVRYFHSVWHLFDIAGTVLQFVSLLLL